MPRTLLAADFSPPAELPPLSGQLLAPLRRPPFPAPSHFSGSVLKPRGALSSRGSEQRGNRPNPFDSPLGRITLAGKIAHPRGRCISPEQPLIRPPPLCQ